MTTTTTLKLSEFTTQELIIMLKIAQRIKAEKTFRTDLIKELSYRMDEDKC